MKRLLLILLSFFVLSANQYGVDSFVSEETGLIQQEKNFRTYDFFDVGKSFLELVYMKTNSFEEGEKWFSFEGEGFEINKSLFDDNKGIFVDFFSSYLELRGPLSLFDSTTTIYSFGVVLGKEFSKNFILSLGYFYEKIELLANGVSFSENTKNINMDLFFKHKIFRNFYLQGQLAYSKKIDDGEYDGGEFSRQYTIGLARRNIYFYLGGYFEDDRYALGLEVFINEKIKLLVSFENINLGDGDEREDLSIGLNVRF